MMQGENEWTESIRNQVKRLSSLTNQITMLARMEEAQKKNGAGRDGFFSCVKRNDTAVLYTGRKKWEKFCVFGRFRAHTEGQQRTFKAARDDTG